MMTVTFYSKADNTMFTQQGVELLGQTQVKDNGRWRKVWAMNIWDDENGDRTVTLPVKDYDLFRVREA
jgi:hypothetical protein